MILTAELSWIPNEEIRHAVATLFKAFRITGSAYGVVRYFAENNLSFPKRAYGGAWDGKITWGTLTHSRVLAVIHNPSYAGAYVYGRYRDNKTVDADGHFEHHPVRLPDKNDWKVFLPAIIRLISPGKSSRKTRIALVPTVQTRNGAALP